MTDRLEFFFGFGPEMGPHIGPMGPNWAPRDGILFWGWVGANLGCFYTLGLRG